MDHELLFADDARLLTTTYVKDNINSELKQVNDCIHKAIENGVYRCFYYALLHDGTIKKLRQLGYTVECYLNNNNHCSENIYYEIIW